METQAKKLTPAQLVKLRKVANGEDTSGPGSLKVMHALRDAGYLDGCYKLTDKGRAAL